MDQHQKKSIAIVGTGISGMRCAHLLAKNSGGRIASITLFEKSDRIGGVLAHTQKNGFLFEHGAQGVLSSRESFRECVENLGITSQMLVPPHKKLRRYLLMPFGTRGLFPGFFSLLRILCEPFIHKSSKPILNETIYDFFARRFGKKFADRCVIPLTFGIWAGGAKKILMRYSFPDIHKMESVQGSLVKNFFYRLIKSKKENQLCSFHNGMSTLVQSLYADLKKICDENQIELVTLKNTAVAKIISSSHEVTVSSLAVFPAGSMSYSFNTVVYTGQPWRDPDLTLSNTPESQKAWSVLQNIPTHSIAVVGLGGKTTAPHLSGFGALAGTWSKDILGVLSVHSIYPAHAPKDCFLYRVMMGGEANPHVDEKSTQDLISLAKERLFQTGVLSQKHTEFHFEDAVVWKNYIPLPTDYQDRVFEAVWKLEALNSGIFFAGNYLAGVAVADCLKQAETTAHHILKFINIDPIPVCT